MYMVGSHLVCQSSVSAPCTPSLGLGFSEKQNCVRTYVCVYSCVFELSLHKINVYEYTQCDVCAMHMHVCMKVERVCVYACIYTKQALKQLCLYNHGRECSHLKKL